MGPALWRANLRSSQNSIFKAGAKDMKGSIKLDPLLHEQKDRNHKTYIMSERSNGKSSMDIAGVFLDHTSRPIEIVRKPNFDAAQINLNSTLGRQEQS